MYTNANILQGTVGAAPPLRDLYRRQSVFETAGRRYSNNQNPAPQAVGVPMILAGMATGTNRQYGQGSIYGQ